MDAPLVVSSYTLAIQVGFAERVGAAAQAGFAGIGLRGELLGERPRRRGDARDGARARGGHPRGRVPHRLGPARGPRRRAAGEGAHRRAHGAAFGVRQLKAGLLEHLPEERIRDAFAQLCARVGDDLIVALEFMPYSGVPDLATAWRVIEGVPNAGLIVDGWHWARAHQSRADLASIPPERIVSVQLCDVRAEPMSPLRAESLGYRLPPGCGHGDTVGLVRALAEHGVTPLVVAVEVISDELVAKGVDTAARVCADAARAVLATVSARS